jgi:hypothetical protein
VGLAYLDSLNARAFLASLGLALCFVAIGFGELGHLSAHGFRIALVVVWISLTLWALWPLATQETVRRRLGWLQTSLTAVGTPILVLFVGVFMGLALSGVALALHRIASGHNLG